MNLRDLLIELGVIINNDSSITLSKFCNLDIQVYIQEQTGRLLEPNVSLGYINSENSFDTKIIVLW